MTDGARQWIRKTSLILVKGDKGLDLSELHFVFNTQQDDEESPNNCSIRVYNLSEDTVKTIQGEYSEVVLQAGYEGDNYGVIFKGTIKQYRIGKESDGISTFLDILAADGDMAYNFAIVNATMAAGASWEDRYVASVNAMKQYGVETGQVDKPPGGGILPRGKVLFGMARAQIRGLARNNGATWSIQDGKVNVTTLTGYLPGEAVELTAETGLIGRAEQTEEGLRARCLLNPRITPGNLVKINNGSINQTQGSFANTGPGQQAYNRYAGIQLFASVAADGIYRAYVVEHSGDTRGIEYYSDLILLAVDPDTNKVEVKNGS